ncbi:DUF6192 family protein [Streptomyces sp. L-9-10]|uniref:DUF6192 family protein n=1 Tax=Streptomyces sp. L-9-10 TaxID=1478131 RepID=UPI00101C5708|nr:DUF6192 family protein [Streptomyces sp. L-9-10]
MPEPGNNIPLFWSQEGRTAEIVKCHFGHLAARKTFESVGGCPYCNHTPGERVAALRTAHRATQVDPPARAETTDEHPPELVRTGREMVRSASAVQFKLGDLILEAVPPHEKQDQVFQPLEKFAEALGISPAALARYRRVAAAWPRNKRDSHTSWSVHAILAGHPDRFDLIKHPPPGPAAAWTCKVARIAMKDNK